MQVGFSVLEISKELMYNFHYEKWMKLFPDAKLLFTDTDSLCYMVYEDPYKVMAKIPDEFDFSEYPKTHELYDVTNMKVLGKMKDETKGLPMVSYIGLRPKLYCLKHLNINKKTAEIEVVDQIKGKGLTETVRKNQLTFADFEKCVEDRKVKTVVQRTIGSDHHHLYTYEINKIGLSAADDKRWICDDGISTLAHGHCKLFS